MTTPSAVAVFAGARDRYQLPLALHEAGNLHTLVTDFYWGVDGWAMKHILPAVLPSRLLRARYCQGLSSQLVSVDARSLGLSVLMTINQRWHLQPNQDKALGLTARRAALDSGSALFSYSYYAASAFLPQPEALPHRFIFQVHPHPIVVRRILMEELDRNPRTSASIVREYEIGLPEAQFLLLAREPHLANGWTVASSFTANTLAAQGIPPDRIHVVPYGVDLTSFPLRVRTPDPSLPFTIAFVGTLTQRKGLSDLLDAVRLLGHRGLRVVLCGRGFFDEALLESYRDLPLEVHKGLPTEKLVSLLQESDIMVLPSIVEGFGHVILEAMACGVPVMTTPHTCGPDVVEEGKHGFIVPIRNPAAIADKLAWGIANRQALADMGRAAATQAHLFTWERFRAGIRQAYLAMLASTTV